MRRVVLGLIQKISGTCSVVFESFASSSAIMSLVPPFPLPLSFSVSQPVPVPFLVRSHPLSPLS